MQKIANPIVEYESIAEAEKALGFQILVPNDIGADPEHFFVIDGKTLSLVYHNNVTYRMAEGTEDISGVWDQYAEVNETTVGNYKVTEKGCYGRVFLSTWTDGKFTFSLTAPHGVLPNGVAEVINSLTPVDGTSLLNPMKRYDYVFEAEYAAGIPILVPSCLHDKSIKEIYVISGKVAELLYDNDIVYRTAKGLDDISGVYRKFAKQDAFRVDRFSVLAKGQGDLYFLTLWNDGKYCFSLYTPHGIHRKEVEEFIGSLKQTN